MTIVQTAKKSGVSAYKYTCNRVASAFEIPFLSQLITEKKAH
jgi:6,7-dimethyl-8-ribityllumazine synthase